MPDYQRAAMRELLSRWRRTIPISTGLLLAAYEELVGLASNDPLLGEQWYERQKGAVEDVRDWLTRLQEGDDS